MLLIVFASILAVFIYFVGVKPYKYWKEKNILYVKPWPVVGNMGSLALQTRSMYEVVQNIYNSFPKERYFGMYMFLQPTLVINDLDLIKRITVKDFETFPEHRTFVPEHVDPLFAKNLFSMPGGDRWRDMRATVSPSFTSSKLRIMFGLMRDCANQFVDYFEKQGGTVTVEMKDIFSRFTNDVIATTAFGVVCDSLKNQENEFYLMGKDASDFTGLKALKVFLYTISPTIMSIFKVTVLSKQVDSFFRKLIKETLLIREQHQVIRPDMLHLLIEARKGRLKHDEKSEEVDSGYAVVQESEIGKIQKRNKAEISDEDITAQALIFFLGGFDTASTTMCFAAYELAVNSETQEKLRKEVDHVLEDCDDGQVSYEALFGMKYLDMVITETLRKWPPIALTDRRSVKPFTIEPELPWEKPVHFDAGTLCWIPIYPIQRDPKFYPDPERFDPERFNDHNKHSIRPFTYLPFGIGPRGCIGYSDRSVVLVEMDSHPKNVDALAVDELCKASFRKFEIVPVEKTPIPIVLSKKSLFPAPEGGFWLGLKPRKG